MTVTPSPSTTTRTVVSLKYFRSPPFVLTPNRTWKHSEFDFAVIQLRQRISFSNKVQPICLEEPGNATLVSPYDYGAKFFKAPKRVSGYLRRTRGQGTGANTNSTVFSRPYRLKPSDLCDPKCQTGAPTSTEVQLQEQSTGGGLEGCSTSKAPSKGPPPPDSFLVGSTVASWHGGKWYLAGIVTNSYCNKDKDAKHFVSLIAAAAPGNLRWIRANVGQPSKYTCLDGTGTGVDPSLVCDGKVDCRADGGSDEETAYCEARNCPAGALNEELCKISGEDGPLLVRNGPNSVIHVDGPDRTKLKPPASTTPKPSPVTTRPTSWPTTTRPVSIGIAFPGGVTASTNRPPRPQSPKPSTPKPTATSAMPSSGSGIGGGRQCPPIKSSMKDSEGIQFKCNSPAPGGPTQNDTHRHGHPQGQGSCSASPQPSGTRILQTCMPGYKAADRISFSEMTCTSEGTWNLRGRHLTCIVECGLPKTSLIGQIVNGTASEPANWPWNAALFKRVQPQDTFEYICGATLITPTHVVTAAHCLEGARAKLQGGNNSLRLVLGPVSSRWSANVNHRHTQIMDISEIHVHEHYNSVTFEADIVVLKLKSPVLSTNHEPSLSGMLPFSRP